MTDVLMWICVRLFKIPQEKFTGYLGRHCFINSNIQKELNNKAFPHTYYCNKYQIQSAYYWIVTLSYYVNKSICSLLDSALPSLMQSNFVSCQSFRTQFSASLQTGTLDRERLYDLENIIPSLWSAGLLDYYDILNWRN